MGLASLGPPYDCAEDISHASPPACHRSGDSFSSRSSRARPKPRVAPLLNRHRSPNVFGVNGSIESGTQGAVRHRAIPDPTSWKPMATWSIRRETWTSLIVAKENGRVVDERRSTQPLTQPLTTVLAMDISGSMETPAAAAHQRSTRPRRRPRIFLDQPHRQMPNTGLDPFRSRIEGQGSSVRQRFVALRRPPRRTSPA